LALGPQADQRRARLYDDSRFKALKALGEIDLLPLAELEGWEHAITGMPACPQFHEGAISDTPTCPYCHLRPSQNSEHRSAEAVLDTLDVRLDEILARWRQALRSALESETAQNSLGAMAPQEQVPIEAFLDQEDEAAAIPKGFVRAATQALQGIDAVSFAVEDLVAALQEGGLPCTVDALQQRFGTFISKTMRGHDPRNTRLTLN
jgi:hypothetical protein